MTSLTLVHGLSQQVRAAVACSGTAGWAGAHLESANGSSWTLTIQFHTPIANSKCRKPPQQGCPDGTQYGWNCSSYRYSWGVPACAAGTNYDLLSCSATQPVQWVHHMTMTIQTYEWRTPRTVSGTWCAPVWVHLDFQAVASRACACSAQTSAGFSPVSGGTVGLVADAAEEAW